MNDVLQSEFSQTLGSLDVHIVDPFTETDTFITRLVQSGLIAPEELAHKYVHKIHANEIVLLAYYIAAINIEAVYHTMSGGDYQPSPSATAANAATDHNRVTLKLLNSKWLNTYKTKYGAALSASSPTILPAVYPDDRVLRKSDRIAAAAPQPVPSKRLSEAPPRINDYFTNRKNRKTIADVPF